MSRFQSSLGRRAQIITVVALLLLALTIVIFGQYAVETSGVQRLLPVVGIILLVLMVLYLYAIAPQGIEICDGKMVIVRRWGTKTLDLSGAVTVRRVDKNDLFGLIRLFGVGGLFGWFGLFRSRGFGNFHMYATRLDRLVLTEFSNRRVVVSADDPDSLVAVLKSVVPHS